MTQVNFSGAAHTLQARTTGRGAALAQRPCDLLSSRGGHGQGLAPTTQKRGCSKVRIRAVLRAEGKESGLGAGLSGRLCVHTHGAGVAWGGGGHVFASCQANWRGLLGPPLASLLSSRVCKRSHGMDEITYEECTEKEVSRAEPSAISHVSV